MGNNRRSELYRRYLSRTRYYTLALEFQARSLKIKAEFSDPKRMGEDFLLMAVTYRRQGNFPKALEYYQKVLELYDLDEILSSQPKEIASRNENSAVVTEPTVTPFAVNISKISSAGIPIISTLNHLGTMYLYNND